MSRMTRPQGTIDYAYDRFGALSRMSYYGRSVTYDHDFRGRIRQAEGPGGKWNYLYNPAGKKTEVLEQGTRSRETRTYDPVGWLDKVTHTDAAGAIMFECDYVLGVDGRRIGANEKRNDAVSAVWKYEYDPLGRLTRERRDANNDADFTDDVDRDVSYTYDKDSNRVSETDNRPGGLGWVKTYAYEPNSQRLSTIHKGSALFESYTWHPGGQMASRTDHSAGRTTEYNWDGERLVKVEIAEGGETVTVEMEYDSRGELVGRKETRDSEVTADHRYLVDLDNPTAYSQTVVEIDAATGHVGRLNTFAEELKAVEDTAGSGSSGLVLTDGLGSVRGVTGPSGMDEDATPSRRDYSAFGSSISSPTDSIRYAFSGQAKDSTLQLQHHRGRWLSTQTGSWASQDQLFDFPLGLGNQYCYVGHSPISSIDLTGSYSLTEVAVTAGIIGFLVGTIIGASSGLSPEKVLLVGVGTGALFIGIALALMKCTGNAAVALTNAFVTMLAKSITEPDAKAHQLLMTFGIAFLTSMMGQFAGGLTISVLEAFLTGIVLKFSIALMLGAINVLLEIVKIGLEGKFGDVPPDAGEVEFRLVVAFVFGALFGLVASEIEVPGDTASEVLTEAAMTNWAEFLTAIAGAVYQWSSS